MQDGGVIPVTGFPHDGGKETRNATDTVQTKGASHTTHANVLGLSSRGYTFEACISERVEFRRGK